MKLRSLLQYLTPGIGAYRHYQDLKKDSDFLRQRLSKEDFNNLTSKFNYRRFKHPIGLPVSWEMLLLSPFIQQGIFYLSSNRNRSFGAMAGAVVFYLVGAGLMRKLEKNLVDKYQETGMLELKIPTSKVVTIR